MFVKQFDSLTHVNHASITDNDPSDADPRQNVVHRKCFDNKRF